MMKKRIAGGYAAPYAGSGKLSDYRKDGSWMMNQMEKGYENCERGVTVKKDENGQAKFASKRVNALAMSLAESVLGHRLAAVHFAGDDDDNVTVISAAWCMNRAGVCVSFAVPIMVMDLGEIADFGAQFRETVEDAYGNMLEEKFSPKTEDPIVCSTPAGELIMMWSFQGDGDDETVGMLRNFRIDEIKYE